MASTSTRIVIALVVLSVCAAAAFHVWQDDDEGPASRIHARFALDLAPDRLADLAAASVRGFKRDDLRRIADLPKAEREAQIAAWQRQAEAMLGQSTFDLVLFEDGSYHVSTALGGAENQARGTWEEDDGQLILTATHSQDVPLSEPQVTVVPFVEGVLRVPWFDTALHLKPVD